MWEMSSRHESSKRVTRDQRIAEALVKAAPGSARSRGGTASSTHLPRPIDTSRSERSSKSSSRSPKRSPSNKSSPDSMRSSPSNRSGPSQSPSRGGAESDRESQRKFAQQLFEQFRTMSRAFHEADTDRSGYLDKMEVWKLCTRFSLVTTEVTNILNHMDTNGDGQISYEEFTTALISATKSPGLYAAVPRSDFIDRRPKKEATIPEEDTLSAAAIEEDAALNHSIRRMKWEDFETRTPGALSTRSAPVTRPRGVSDFSPPRGGNMSVAK